MDTPDFNAFSAFHWLSYYAFVSVSRFRQFRLWYQSLHQRDGITCLFRLYWVSARGISALLPLYDLLVLGTFGFVPGVFTVARFSAAVKNLFLSSLSRFRGSFPVPFGQLYCTTWHGLVQHFFRLFSDYFFRRFAVPCVYNVGIFPIAVVFGCISSRSGHYWRDGMEWIEWNGIVLLSSFMLFLKSSNYDMTNCIITNLNNSTIRVVCDTNRLITIWYELTDSVVVVRGSMVVLWYMVGMRCAGSAMVYR